MLNEDIADVSEDERHWSPWLCIRFFRIIPRIAVSINAASAVAIDMNPFSRDDESSMVVLKSNRIGVISPIVKVVGQLVNISEICYFQIASLSRRSAYSPHTFPFNRHISYYRIQLCGNPVILIFWKHDSPTTVAIFKCFEYLWSIVFLIA